MNQSIRAMHYPRTSIVLTFCISILLAGCGTNTAPQAPTLAAFPGTPTAVCLQEEVLPKITDIRPAEIKPGSEVTVSGTGGFLRDTCGGYNESARLYKVYLDDQPVGDLSCYVNHCEGKFVLAEDTAIGTHCVGVQKGSCQVKLDVTRE